MATSSRLASDHVGRILGGKQPEEILARLAPKTAPLPVRLPGGSKPDPVCREKRWQHLGNPACRALLENPGADYDVYRRNIENLVGHLQIPIGIAGPLRVNGASADGDYFVPLATTEAALVASYARGCLAVSEAGGCSAAVLAEGVTRVPGFVFRNLAEAGSFVAWLSDRIEQLRNEAAKTTRHGSLEDVRFTMEGNHVYLHLQFLTGDASGQNMVTIAAAAICDYIDRESPVRPERIYVEANLSGDKKASSQSFQSVRGRKVVAEVRMPAAILQKRLKATASAMVDYWRMSVLGGVLGGTIGVQGHYANGLAALFIATGQDAATVSEAAVGITRFEQDGDDLYAAVTLPNLIVGTVGGGTGLPTQAACLDLLGLRGTGQARALAEVCAGLSLAGELSIIAALATGTFAKAHQKLARGKTRM